MSKNTDRSEHGNETPGFAAYGMEDEATRAKLNPDVSSADAAAGPPGDEASGAERFATKRPDGPARADADTEPGEIEPHDGTGGVAD